MFKYMDEESNTYSNKYSKIHIQRECMFFLFLRKTKYKLFKKNDENTNYAQKKKQYKFKCEWKINMVF